MSRPLPPPCFPICQLARLASAPHPNVATWIAPPQLVSSAEGGTGSTAAHYLVQTFDLCDCDLIALVQSQPGRRLGEELARVLFAQVLGDRSCSATRTPARTVCLLCLAVCPFKGASSW